MKKHYDFSNARSNPYAKRLKKAVTIRLDEDTVDYFKRMAQEAEIPYQTLINLYLRDCAASSKHLKLEWMPRLEGPAQQAVAADGRRRSAAARPPSARS